VVVAALVEAAATQYSVAFHYTNSVQQWIVPAGVATFSVDAYGAKGGDLYEVSYFYYNSTGRVDGGKGGYIAVSNISVTQGETFYITVGAAGAFDESPGLGGGGGAIESRIDFASGGGATDLRTIKNDLSSRLVVAGGGGGAGNIGKGGAGGGSTAQDGEYYYCGGGGGNQTQGGAKATDAYSFTSNSGSFGQGGAGLSLSGGGGGGYYGGGGGADNCGGGGGSSYAKNSFTITRNKQGVKSGHGELYITYTSCTVGYYLLGSSCLACAAGTYNPSYGSSTCHPCAANTYSSAGSSSCNTFCPYRTFAHGTAACIVPTLMFAFNNSIQKWIVPEGVASFSIDAFGAQGGDYPLTIGGLGGYISVNSISVTPVGRIYYIVVGASGAANSPPGIGGGGGHTDEYFYSSGGGATDLRTSANELYSRLVVAGGGGGSGANAYGGAGGGRKGQAGGNFDPTHNFVGGGGGSQTAGGAGHKTNTQNSNSLNYSSLSGTFGEGGNGTLDSGGGGGGYYGGGGGVSYSGGGGGSSFANSSFFDIVNNTQGINSGNGVLYITLFCKAGYSSCACTAGYFYSAAAQACIACRAGTYNSLSDQTLPSACKECAPGSVTNTLTLPGATSCTPCSAGSYSSSSQVACEACAKGSFSSNCASPSCAAASKNMPTGPNGGGTGCTQVSQGYCASNGANCVASGAGDQLICAKGTFGVSQTNCEGCAAGSYQVHTRALTHTR